MNYFYLNETLGGNYCLGIVSNGLKKIIDGFNILVKEQKLLIHKGWVLEKEPCNIVLAGNKLQNIINSLDIERKRLFYSYTTVYPIHKYFKDFSDDDLLKKNYVVQGCNAMNIAIVSMSKGVLLSLPLAPWLQKNTIIISNQKNINETLEANNLYGNSPCNLDYITEALLKINRNATSGLERIKLLTKNVILEDKFVSEFNSATPQTQSMIIKRFEEAKDKNVILPLNPNDSIAKRVSPHVIELRIVNPFDVRVYFYETNKNLYIASMALKNEYVGKNDQNNDINDAEKVLSKYANRCIKTRSK